MITKLAINAQLDFWSVRVCANPVLRNAVLAQFRKESWYVLSVFLDISLMEAILVLLVLLAVLNVQI